MTCSSAEWLRGCGLFRPPAARDVLLSRYEFDVVERPASIEISLRGCVEAEVRKPEPVRHRLYPVRFLASGSLRAEVDVHRAVSVLLESLGRRGHFCLEPLVADQAARVHVVDRDGPELLHWRIRRDPQSIRLAAVEPVAVLVA